MACSSQPPTFAAILPLEKNGLQSAKDRARGKAVINRICRQEGFTLVESIMAVVVFTMLMMGVYSALIRSYHLSALSRCYDDARAILRSYVDQFQRLQTTEKVNNVDLDRYLFTPTASPTGRGLVTPTTGLSDETVYINLPEADYLNITLGGEGHEIAAKLTRQVNYVNATTGAITNTKTITAAGSMLTATFTISFNLNDKSYTESMTVLRVAP